MDIRIVLVRTRNPLHIGATARAMANFGLRDLAVVRPYAAAWREARSAVGAIDVLRRARQLSLIEAVRDCHLVLGTTTGRRRTLLHPLIPLPGLSEYIKERLLFSGGRVAILFGSEKTGLSNREVEHCHALVRIPTSPETPSVNLAQALAVVVYELAKGRDVSKVRAPQEQHLGQLSSPPTTSFGDSSPRMAFPRAPSFALPTQEQIEVLVKRTRQVLERIDYMQHMPEDTQCERLRQAFKRWRLTLADAALLQAIFKRVQEKLGEEHYAVVPAKAGIQRDKSSNILDPRLRGGDVRSGFL